MSFAKAIQDMLKAIKGFGENSDNIVSISSKEDEELIKKLENALNGIEKLEIEVEQPINSLPNKTVNDKLKVNQKTQETMRKMQEQIKKKSEEKDLEK